MFCVKNIKTFIPLGFAIVLYHFKIKKLHLMVIIRQFGGDRFNNLRLNSLVL